MEFAYTENTPISISLKGAVATDRGFRRKIIYGRSRSRGLEIESTATVIRPDASIHPDGIHGQFGIIITIGEN